MPFKKPTPPKKSSSGGRDPRRPSTPAKPKPKGSGYAASQHPVAPKKPTPKPTNSYYRNLGENDARVNAPHQAAANARAIFGDTPTDPFNGANMYDLLAGMTNKHDDGGGGGGGGYGGGGGASAMSKDAYAQMLATLNGQSATMGKLFDDRTASLNGYQTAGNDRLGGILTDLMSGAARTRGDVSASYASGQNMLGNLASQFAEQEAGRAAGAGRTLGMFGAPEGMVERGYGAADTVNAQRSMLAGQAGAADAQWANRGNVYNGLMGDAKTANSQLFDQLLAQVAMQKQQQAMADEQAKAQLGIQAAQAGVTL